MRLFFAALAVCCLLALTPTRSNAQDFFEVFGGYSFVHDSASITSAGACAEFPCPATDTNTFHPNLNGWDLAATIKPGTWYGITADFGGTYGSVGGSSVHLQTYLFGPKVALPGPISPFAHVLVGAAHQTIGSGTTSQGITVPGSETAFAAALGAGIDIKLAPFIAVRPIQIDYLLTRFNSNTESQPRISAGLVLRF
jgi:opacity protein-like surface antigen